MKPDCFSARMAVATLAGDRRAAIGIAGKALQEIGEDLMQVIERYPSEDLPFCVAAMSILSGSMLGMLPDSGKSLVQTLTAHTSAVVIEKDAFMTQLRQEEDPT